MKTASAATQAILANANNVPVKRADLYTFILKDGTVLRFTDADRPLIVGGNTFGTQVGIKRSRTKQKVGIDVDNITIDIYANRALGGGDTRVTEAGDRREVDGSSDIRITETVGGYSIGGKPIIVQFRNGLFDGASVLVQKLFLSSWDDTSPGAVDWFEGEVADVACGYGSVNLRVESILSRLNQQMPRFLYQSSCNNTTFDSGCDLAQFAFTFAGSATSIVSRSKFTFTGTSQADGYFNLGKVTILNGPNAGQSRTVKSYVAGVIEVFRPFPYDIDSGTLINVTAGDDKTLSTCKNKFNNLLHNRSFPFIPIPETAIEGGSAPGTASAPGSTGRGAVGSNETARRAPGSYEA